MLRFAFLVLLGSFSFFGHSKAYSMSLDWSGGYRTEYTTVDNLMMGNPKGNKTYILNNLWLAPKIIAADGVNVTTRFQVMPNRDSRYVNSQAGQVWGEGVGTGTPSHAEDSNVLSHSPRASTLLVDQMYLNVNNEFGQLTIGRAPLHFGLGMTYNGGTGPFDHWYDSRDMIAYKAVSGNAYLMPIFAKINEGNLGRTGYVDEQMFHLQYENLEAGSLFGIFYQSRRSGLLGNDLPAAALGGVAQTGFASTRYNLLMGRDFGWFSFKFEAGFLNGETGIFTPTGKEIKMSSYGVASEFYFGTPAEKTRWVLRTGAASGDNPGTENYEGYVFNRNYDIAFLMFNHPMGQKDFFKTALQRDASKAVDTALDDEALSNVFYLSPQMHWQWTDKVTLVNTLTWAKLNANPIDGLNVDKNVGMEWDFSLNYKPLERVTWNTQLGVLLPGAMFKADTLNYDTGTAIGFATKVAITF